MNKLVYFLIGIIAINLISCSKVEEVVKPNLSLQFVKLLEGNEGETSGVAEIKLNIPAVEDIVLTFHTQDSTAISGKDYVGISEGTITISAGQTSASIPVTVLGDKILEFTEMYILVFNEPENATLTSPVVSVIITDDDQYQIEKDADGYITPDSYEDFTLVWSEEFDASEIDTNTWTFEIGNGSGGWGNNELQFYTDEPENAHIENGKLVITAINASADTYTSARMITKDKQEFQFGRIDIRAKLPKGQGIWPALWMLGYNIDDVSWPKCGEIDIMELIGNKPNEVHGTLHYDNGSGWEMNGFGTGINPPATFADEFHVFTILWEKDNIKWYLDYEKFHEVNVSAIGVTYPFNNPFFFILNVAVGGNWPGSPDETTVFPQSMIVDYVRVFR